MKGEHEAGYEGRDRSEVVCIYIESTSIHTYQYMNITFMNTMIFSLSMTDDFCCSAEKRELEASKMCLSVHSSNGCFHYLVHLPLCSVLFIYAIHAER